MRSSSSEKSSFRSLDKFVDMNLSDGTQTALRMVFKYERLSAQQSKYMPLMMRSDTPDVFVKAGTGSGKTLGFLIPSVEALLTRTHSIPSSTAKGIRVLILSPTRELAAQTCDEANRLLSFHDGFRAAVVTGGTDRNKDLQGMKHSPPNILIATPGRLQDLLKAIPRLLSKVKVVVLDEADRLLDPGFAPAVKRILATLPATTRARRRTLLLTATVPPEVKDVAKQFMRTGFEYVDASGGIDAKGPANVGVSQVAVLCGPFDVHIELARTLLAHHMSFKQRAKVLVFFGSIALAELFATLFRAHKDPAWTNLLELHGGLAQNKRTRAMEDFKKSTGGVMFASDAAGRGIDIPNVTLVVQIGSASPDVYQQRVGRTGRAGVKGLAIVLLGKDEKKALGPIQGIAPTIEVVEAIEVGEHERKSFLISVKDTAIAERAFKGALGAYKANAKMLGWKSQDLVDAVAARVLGMGLNKVPEVSPKTLGKMGLSGVSFDTLGIRNRLSKVPSLHV